MTEARDIDLWRRILAADLPSHGYFTERQDWPGAAVFTATTADDFSIAVLQQSAPDAADALLERIITHYSGLGLTPVVRVTPLSTPADWPQRLAARGFTKTADSEVFMRLVGPFHGAINLGLDVRRAPEETDLADFATTQLAGFGSDDSADFWVAQALRNRERWDYRFLVAYLENQPVGALSARFEPGVVGLYGLATRPAYRGRGVGTTLLAAVIDEARQRGAGLIFLSALPDSAAARLYERLGFAPLFTADTYALSGLSSPAG